MRNFGTPQFALAVSFLALAVSLAQLYLTNFYKWSQLRIIVSEGVESSANFVTKDNGDVHFTATSHLTISAVNYGNAPSALIQIFLVMPIDDGTSCKSMPAPKWFSTSSERYNDMVVDARSFSIKATTVNPGAIVTLTGEIRVEDAVRRKAEVGKPKERCLLFVAMDHNARVFTKSISAWTKSIQYNSGGFGPSEDIQKPITIIGN